MSTPILTVENGETTAVVRVRTHAKALAEIGAQIGVPAHNIHPKGTRDQLQKAAAALEELRTTIEKTFDHVGEKFPEEARKMHYGEVEHRSIYGEASPDEAKELHEEGIEFHPLPVLPDERN